MKFHTSPLLKSSQRRLFKVVRMYCGTCKPIVENPLKELIWYVRIKITCFAIGFGLALGVVRLPVVPSI